MTSDDFRKQVQAGDIISLYTKHGLGLVRTTDADLVDCVMYAVTKETGLQHWKHADVIDKSKK